MDDFQSVDKVLDRLEVYRVLVAHELDLLVDYAQHLARGCHIVLW